jgi:hypothetical protein
MASTNSAQRPTVNADITSLLKELQELGKRARPIECQRPGQQSVVVVKGK